ncbi:hypothetical protein ACTFIW_009092 [Dictyostelium discoideum]
MSTYAEIAKIPQIHLDDESAQFIQNYANKTEHLKDHYSKLITAVQDIDTYCKKLLSNTNLTAYERNNGFYSISLEYPITSTIDLTDTRKKLVDYCIPIDKIFIGKGRKKKIHMLIKHEETLIKLLKDRTKLGSFITTSRDYHIITGRVKIAKDKIDVINALLKNSYKDEIPYALYNIDYSGDSYHIFALIEYKIDDGMKSTKNRSNMVDFTFRKATGQHFYQSRAKNGDNESGKNNKEKDKQNDYNSTDTQSKSDNNKHHNLNNNDTKKPDSNKKNKKKVKSKNTITLPNTGDQLNTNLISGPKEEKNKSDSKDLVVDIKDKITKRKNELTQSTESHNPTTPEIQRTNPYTPSTPTTPSKSFLQSLVGAFTYRTPIKPPLLDIDEEIDIISS